MIEKVEFLGHANCLRIANTEVDLIVSTDVGPRVLRYGFIGQENILGEYPNLSTPTAWGDWKPWGGHRLWVAPEQMPLSYAPDNAPIRSEVTGESSVRLIQPPDDAGFEKEIAIDLAGAGASVAVHHRIVNRNEASVRIAPWAITVMRGGGTTLIPQEPFRSHDDALMPARSLVLWYFTDLTDSRIQLGRKFIRLSTDATKLDPQKIGAANQQGWCAYHHHATRTLFVKQMPYDRQATYPDFGANTETYAAGKYMEIETLGPLVILAPGAAVDHTERWQLFGGIQLGHADDEIEPVIKGFLNDHSPGL